MGDALKGIPMASTLGGGGISGGLCAGVGAAGAVAGGEMGGERGGVDGGLGLVCKGREETRDRHGRLKKETITKRSVIDCT